MTGLGVVVLFVSLCVPGLSDAWGAAACELGLTGQRVLGRETVMKVSVAPEMAASSSISRQAACMPCTTPQLSAGSQTLVVWV